MPADLPISNGVTNGVNGHGSSKDATNDASSFSVKAGLARMLKGGVIMDVVNAEQVSQRLLPDFSSAPPRHFPIPPY
jgi:pyridoxal 5'-phosphate synthase pdxS subunit